MIELVVKLTLVPKSEHLDDEEFLVGAASIGYPKTSGGKSNCWSYNGQEAARAGGKSLDINTRAIASKC